MFTGGRICGKVKIMENITPMLRQYRELKSQCQDHILFFRLGDFYEMFGDDARTASPILNVVLTSRDAGKAGRIPMCGIPYHARDAYIAKLIKAGRKVAICEQVEDPALAKGLVRREVIKVVTAGTFVDEQNHDARYLAAIAADGADIGIAFTDVVHGHIQTNQFARQTALTGLLAKLPVTECIYPLAQEKEIRDFFRQPVLNNKSITLTGRDDWRFNRDIARTTLCEHFKTQSLRGYGIDGLPLACASAGALLDYIKEVNRTPARHICRLSRYLDSENVFISPEAVCGLGLDDLFTTIDATLTAFGTRLLRNWLYYPLKTRDDILKRQEAVILLKDDAASRSELSLHLRSIPDIEKSIARISNRDTAARDLLALRTTLTRIPGLRRSLAGLAGRNAFFILDDIPELRTLLEHAVNPDVPLSNPEGKIIRSGYHGELDAVRGLQNNARDFLKELQASEIRRTGINSLKIGYTHVFGYYIEITKANLDAIPSDYIRKQTLSNAERFITPQLKEYEEKILNAQETILRIEREIIGRLTREILDKAEFLHSLANQLAALDCIYSLSVLALSDGYIVPAITEDTVIRVEDGRHPVVERAVSDPFIPNDTLLDCGENHLMIITGPNMSGKSTYIRQTAILCVMAQVGSFIPAKNASIGIVDKIFTRIGARDEITRGQSTFMVEMSETAGILNNLSPRSLVILDEIGRGTSTYDGLSLAWAIAEHLAQHKVRALFATHFHELTALAQDHPGVRNYNVAVREWNDEVIFLHKIAPGGSDESYGIYVAKLAGIPGNVIARAKEILMKLELSGKLHEKIRANLSRESQLSFIMDTGRGIMEEIREELAELDVDAVTPLAVAHKVQEWKDKIARYG